MLLLTGVTNVSPFSVCVCELRMKFFGVCLLVAITLDNRKGFLGNLVSWDNKLLSVRVLILA